MIRDIDELLANAWPQSRLEIAFELLAQKSGILPRKAEAPVKMIDLRGVSPGRDVDDWMQVSARQIEIEIDPFDTTYAELPKAIQSAAPAILEIPGKDEEDEPRYLILLSAGLRPRIIGTDMRTHRIHPLAVRAGLCRRLDAPFGDELSSLLDEIGVPPELRERSTSAMLEEMLGNTPIRAGWMLKLSPTTGILYQVRHNKLIRPILTVFLSNIVKQLILVFTWWVIGHSTFEGDLSRMWLTAWALLLFTAIPFQLFITWGQSLFAFSLGGLFKQRLLYGALRLHPDETRHQGSGQFLQRIMESESIELMAISGGLTAITSIVEVAVAVWVLSKGAGGVPHALLLIAWLGVIALFGWHYYRIYDPWVEAYRNMTNDMTERMVGHRTRLAQQAKSKWHEREDSELSHYHELSSQLDRSRVQFAALPRAWVVIGLAGIALSAVGSTPAAIIISIGGVILAYQTIISIIDGMESLLDVLIVWRKQVNPLFEAASQPEEAQRVLLPEGDGHMGRAESLLLAKDIFFRYQQHGRTVLNACSLDIRAGDFILLEGPSGGGKSTLAAVLSGLRLPESGLLLLHGYDRQSLGSETWHRRIVMIPQFHENHVFTGTFAFNLLMGRHWPPQEDDLEEAEEVCRALGLGELLERMPSGMYQIVGESGWQLSHGERSRLFIARALLQNADLVIMDESFGALDPENLEKAMQAVFERTTTLLLIAHP